MLELRHGPLHEALAAAREPLGEIGAALGPEAEVVLLAGNHDHYLVHPWSQRRAGRRTSDRAGSGDAGRLGGRGPARGAGHDAGPHAGAGRLSRGVAATDVWAMHGHYLDVHMTVPSIERLGAGVMRRIVTAPGRGSRPPAAAEDYEAILTPIYAWLHAVAQGAVPGRGRGLQGGSVRGWRALTERQRTPRRPRPGHRGGLAGGDRGAQPRRARSPAGRGLRSALRRSGLRSMAAVCAALGVSADYVIFGHTHRAGPLGGDDPAEWVTARGGRLINSGCWVHEPAFMGADPSQSPYRTGFCVVVEDDGPPRLVNLLDPPSPA